MFNVLNRFISRLDGDGPEPKQNQGTFGFQVLRNTNLELAIEPWFDFIVGINGRMLDSPDPRLFAQEVRNCAGGTVALGLWSAKGQRARAMHIPVPADTGSLGLSLQWAALAAVSNIWHVLDVPAGSPADAAGLLPYSDYVLGTPEGALHGEGGLGELVEDHIGRPLRLWVYNHEFDVTRELAIRPSRDWGGEGALGCVLGYGALHRLPAPLSEPVQAPGETLFDGDEEAAADASFTTLGAGAEADMLVPAAPGGEKAGGDLLLPAQLVSPPPAGGAPPPPRGGKKKDRRGHHSPNNMLDDYFDEGEKKSRELDNAPKGRASPLPPPPKAGGPPGGPPPKTGSTADEKGGGDDGVAE